MSIVGHNGNINQEAKPDVGKPMLWVGIVSIIMLFAVLTSAYIVRQAEGNWLQFSLPWEFYLSTGIIVASSVTMLLAQKAVKNDDQAKLKQSLLVTLLLGIGFAISQFVAWGALIDQGIFFTGARSNASGSYLYVLSGVHLAHLVGGVFALGFTYVKALLGKYSSLKSRGVELTATYWHFLDILWVYLLLFLLFIR